MGRSAGEAEVVQGRRAAPEVAAVVGEAEEEAVL
jgi:hypothetical protein